MSNPHDIDGDGILDEVTLCKACNCMTHTVGLLCGKCKAFKVTHTTIVEVAARYLEKRCNVVLPEFYSHNAELPDVIGWKNEYSTVIEVKVSRGDFFSDRKKAFRIDPDKGMGDYRFYCVPKGLVAPEEVPDGWGLLYVYPSGIVRQAKQSWVKRPISPEEWRWGGRFVKNKDAELHLLYYYARRANYAGVHKTIVDYRGYDV